MPYEHNFCERFFDIILWLAGAGHFVILIASFQVPSRLRWKEDLANLMPFNRKMLWVQSSFTVITIIAFGVLTLCLHQELLRGERAALGLAAFIGIYWTSRILVDAFYFSHQDWPKGRGFVLGHLLLTALFSFLACVGGHSYTVEVDVEIEAGCEAGLLLFYNPEHVTGIALNSDGIGARLANGYVPSHYEKGATRATLRIVNDRQEVDFYFRVQGKPWQRTLESAEISGMQHNVIGGFLDVRPAIYACGLGKAKLRNFRYWPDAKVPG